MMKFEASRPIPPRPDSKKSPKVVELADADVIEDVDDADELKDGDYEIVNDPPESHVRAKESPSAANDNVGELTVDDLIEVLEPGELQEQDVVEAFEIKGFKNLNIAATLEKKNERKGLDVRNQDNIIADADTGLIGVLDGLGGEGAKDSGALASISAETAIPEAYKQSLSRITHLDGADVQKELVENQLARLGTTDIKTLTDRTKYLTEKMEQILAKSPEMGKKALALLEAVSKANDEVNKTGGKTTACVGFIHQTSNGEQWAVVANIGDSGAYKRRKNGEMIPLTDDDSLFNLLRDSRALSPETMAAMKAKPDEKVPILFSEAVVKALGENARPLLGKEMPFSYKKLKLMMVKSMGDETAQTKLSVRRLEPGDSLVFATDGVIDKFEDANTDDTNFAELSQATQGATPTERMNHLREASKQKTTYKKDDDIAIIEAMAA